VAQIILAAALGVWALQQLAVLPAQALWVCLLSSLAFFVFAIKFKKHRWQQPALCVLALLIGVSYAASRAEHRLSEQLSPDWETEEISLTGVIDELPQLDLHSARFRFAVEQVHSPKARVPQHIALSWSNPLRFINEAKTEQLRTVPALQVGERWQLKVRLHRPHASQNPHGFDTEAWLFENNIRAQGSVQDSEHNRRLAAFVWSPMNAVHRLRQTIRERIQTALEAHKSSGVLIALTVGDQQAISSAQWQLFSQTGISHLLSISGMHVTLFASVVAWSVFALWRRTHHTQRLPAKLVAALVTVLFSTAYALLSGFGVPAQRTVLMLGVVAVLLCIRRPLSQWQILAWALFAVLLFDPWAVLSAGFWFSYTAVAFLFFVGFNRARPLTGWRAAVRLQLTITVALAPITLLLFQQVSLLSPLANAVAIPLISFLVVPLCLLWLIAPIDALLQAAALLMTRLEQGLSLLHQAPQQLWQQHAPTPLAVVFALIGTALLFAPTGRLIRGLALPLFLPFFLIKPASPAPGTFELTAIDVGQGLAVLIRTANHSLLYDTGPKWPGGNAGEKLINPMLRGMGLSLSGIVVSHADSDHAGGAKSVKAAHPQAWLASSIEPQHEAASPNMTRCLAGQSWQWDGVHFAVLYPDAAAYASTKKTNDRSCVIHISSPSHSALLTGDIEALSEAQLLASGQPLSAQLLTVPHHGSHTSSTAAFIDAVAPEAALINAGYLNRFAHPRQAVLRRYEDRQIPIHRTDYHGALIAKPVGEHWQISRWRESQRRYWWFNPPL
jgi:competence protein ComEC